MLDNWDEVRTAYQVARMGTVSGAAEVLGVHHATVIRHIDSLEGKLGVKLFQRHARGYTATEAGHDLLQVAQATDDQLTQLAGRIKGQGAGVSGELVITSLASLSPLFAPVLADFAADHENVIVRYLTGERLFRLEYGEAHVAIRAGNAPDQPDNVVQPFAHQRMLLVASDVYIDRYGKPEGPQDFAKHRFIGHDADTRAPFNQWLRRTVSMDNIVFRVTDNLSMMDAVCSGAGIGFLPRWEAAKHDFLVEVMDSLDEWSAPLWLVTHVDLHRTPKVQAFLTFLKARAKSWDIE